MMLSSSNDSSPDTRSIGLWLFMCAGMIFLMTLVGAITRLTGSGLSIVVWQPLSGALPPLNDQAWATMFDLYKDSPEFIKKNSWMTLSDFKAIFFWEWLHRLFGRLIGLAYALPLVWFWVRNRIPAGYKPVLLFLLCLGGAQGVMGWYMVSSGLVDRPEVSHFRLAAHLGFAVALYMAMVWTADGLWSGKRSHGAHAGAVLQTRGLRIHGWIGLYAAVVTLIWGAFTAGLDAGLVYNTFPMMGEHWVPTEIHALNPLWVNFFHNPVAVQFLHRWMGVTTALITIAYCVRVWRNGDTEPETLALGLAVFLQVCLGIGTLLLGVPVWLATAHQGGALAVLALLLLHLRRRS